LLDLASRVPGSKVEPNMSGAAHNLDQEYWQPPAQTPSARPAPMSVEVCPRCNTDFVIGARFCHVCGAEREPRPELTGSRAGGLIDLRAVRDKLGLTLAALLAFVVGIACVVAAVATGLIYTATTTLDWQAVQVWRIEWLLAAAVAFIAGILLNRR
jgi:hypothetical protein